MIGWTGNDTNDDGDGVDGINGGPGSDTIYTGTGTTVDSCVFVSGSGCDDIIYGGADADHLLGSNRVDIINGIDGDVP